jgi:hypothetical protein
MTEFYFKAIEPIDKVKLLSSRPVITTLTYTCVVAHFCAKYGLK